MMTGCSKPRDDKGNTESVQGRKRLSGRRLWGLEHIPFDGGGRGTPRATEVTEVTLGPPALGERAHSSPSQLGVGCQAGTRAVGTDQHSGEEPAPYPQRWLGTLA